VGTVGATSDVLNVFALAQHDRAAVATLQQDFNLAAELYYSAWCAYRDPVRRERVWLDLALNFSEMGLRDVAREALLVIYTKSHRGEARLIAATNLLEIAVADGREDLFNIYRIVLRDASDAGILPAELAAKVALYEGRGETRFGRLDAAVAAFERAIAVGVAHRVNEVTIRGDEELAAIRAGRLVSGWVTPAIAVPMTQSVVRITRVVSRVRRRARAPHQGA
jgi:hypothetical protein